MKKSLIIAGLACVALAACTKNEVVSVAPDQEITFQTISTKAASPLGTGKAFISYAYLVPETESWASATTKTLYINGQKIYYHDNYINSQPAWAAASKYYWPKQGSLTFFAWTDNTNDPTSSVVSCPSDQGITFTSYVTTAANTDLMVAKIAADKTNNPADNSAGSSSSTWAAGVPTVFQHILSSLKLSAKTSDNYTSAKIKITSITIDNLYSTGTYKQGTDASINPIAGTWTTEGTQASINLYTPDTATEINNSETALNISGDDLCILLPQSLTDEQIVVNYSVTTNYGTTLTTNYVYKKKLSELLSDSKLKAGTEYTLKLKIGLDEILWDPAEDPWNTENIDITI